MMTIQCCKTIHVHFAIVKLKVSQMFYFSWMCVAPATLHIHPKAPNDGKDLPNFILNEVPVH